MATPEDYDAGADEGEDKGKYSLGPLTTAKSVYGRMTGKRQSVVDQARLMAELTIPSVFPPDGYEVGDNLPGNNQSVSAGCVNNLASTLMFMAFPPGQPICRFEAPEYLIQPEVDADPQLYSKTVLALSRLEMAHRKRLQTTTIADAYTGFIKQLLVAGNCLWKHIKLNTPSYHKCDSYVVKRDTVGQVLLIIHKEVVSLETLDEDLVDFIMTSADPTLFKDKQEWERTVEIYSVQKLKTDDKGNQSWCYWQEWEGKTLPDTEVETDFETPPMLAGWLIPVYGKDWGRSYCEEYRGDLFTIEAHASALNDGASLAALSLIFVKPGSPTSIKQVREAKNLSTLPGIAEDVTTYRSDKTADFNFVFQNMEAVARRLSKAFLLQTSIQRDGERVTKEEIVRLGRDLDRGMGGLYTQLAQGNQRVIVRRAIRLHEDEAPKLPKLPPEVEVQVVTGIDAMGLSTDGENLNTFAETMLKLFPKTAEAILDGTDFANRAAASLGIKPDGLVKTAQRVAQEQQQQQMQQATMTALDKGVGPAVKGMTDNLNQQGPGASAPPPQQ